MTTTLRYTCKLFDRGHAIVAHCPELDVYSQGYTPEEARRNLGEAVHLFLDEARRRGTLEQILQDAGYSFVPAESRRSRSRSAYSERLEFDLARAARCRVSPQNAAGPQVHLHAGGLYRVANRWQSPHRVEA